MEHPEQALKYIHKCIIFILSNGTLLDQAKMHYLYAKCLHLLNKANSNFEFKPWIFGWSPPKIFFPKKII